LGLPLPKPVNLALGCAGSASGRGRYLRSPAADNGLSGEPFCYGCEVAPVSIPARHLSCSDLGSGGNPLRRHFFQLIALSGCGRCRLFAAGRVLRGFDIVEVEGSVAMSIRPEGQAVRCDQCHHDKRSEALG
jgi:hypothetical protein